MSLPRYILSGSIALGIAFITWGVIDPKIGSYKLETWGAILLVAIGIAIIVVPAVVLSAIALIRRSRDRQNRGPSIEPPKPLIGSIHGRIPPRPPHYMERPEVLSALKELLIGGQGAMSISGAHAVQALQGMGGVGKTVLASVLVNEKDVRLAFPDGIYWITVSRDRELATLQNRLISYLNGEGIPINDIETGRDRIEELLSDKTCLVVLDDVWNIQDVEYLGAVGDRSRVLITTRDVAIVENLDAADYPLSELVMEDALELLSKASRFSRDQLPDTAAEVAKECGYLPLALAVIGSVVSGQSDMWPFVLSALKDGDLERFKADFPYYPYPHVFAAIEVSVDTLGADAARYLDLAIFREDVPIPESVLRKLWAPLGLGEIETRQLIRTFVSRNLCRQDSEGQMVLHDLQGDYIRNRIKGDRLAEVHGRLVDSYHNDCTDGWPSGPNDGYLFQNLAYHLAGAGRGDELNDLLLNFDWMMAKLQHTDVNLLVSDYDFTDDEEMRTVQSAIRLSSHIVSVHPTQLASQLTGSLVRQEASEVTRLVDSVKNRSEAPWLMPTSPSLSSARGPLIRTLSGHGRWVRAVALTPDGRRAVSGSDDNTLKVWDIESGEEVNTLTGHWSSVSAVAVTPDGKRAVSGSDDNTLKVWDIESGKEINTLSGHEGSVTAVAVTPDGTRAVSGSYDNTLKVWDIESGKEINTLSGHGSPVTAVAVTPDGTRAVSSSSDNTLKVWDIESGKEINTLSGHGSPVMAVAVTPDGKRAVSGSDDNTLKVWDIESGKEINTLSGHGRIVTAVAVTPDGTRVVSSSSDNTLKVWDIESGKEINTLSGHGRIVTAVAVTPDGTRAVSSSYDNTLKVWDIESGKEINTLSGHGSIVTAIAVTPDGTRAVSSSYDNTLKVWDIESGQEINTLSGHGSFVSAVAVTPDGTRVVSGSSDNTLKVWDIESGQEINTLSGHGSYVSAVAVTPDGKRAVSGSWDNTLKVWDIESGKEITTLSGHGGLVNAVAVTPDGKRAVSGSGDNTLKVWDIESGNEINTLSGHGSLVSAVAVTPDGKRVVSGSHDTTLKVWDIESGQEINTLSGHGSFVSAVAVTPDGKRAVSGSYDNTLKVWDIESGNVLATFTADGSISGCAVAPDGVTIVAGYSTGAVHFLRLMEPGGQGRPDLR